MSNAVSFELLGENDVSKIYFVDSQSLGQKHCFLITKICKKEILLENIAFNYYYSTMHKNLPSTVDKHLRPL